MSQAVRGFSEMLRKGARSVVGMLRFVVISHEPCDILDHEHNMNLIF